MADEEKKTTPPPEPEAPKADAPAEFTFTEEEIADGKGVAWLSYLGILILVPWLTKKENAFVKPHVRQGLMIIIIFIALSILCSLTAIPVIGLIFMIVGALGYLANFVCAIISIVNAFQGKFWKMPLVGDWAQEWFKSII